MSEERKSRYELFLEEQEKPQEKRCSKCKQMKALSEYQKDRHKSIGVASQCKACMSNRRRKYKGPIDRFWKLYHSRTERAGECIEWTGACTADGHPMCQMDKKWQPVRRVVYRLAIGDLPDNMFVLTKCNNCRCVKHSHLKIGTRTDYIAKLHSNGAVGDRNGMRRHPERVARGDRNGMRRHPERNKASKLNEHAIPEIFALRQSGLTHQKIAQRFSVSRATIGLVLSGKSWTHVSQKVTT